MVWPKTGVFQHDDVLKVLSFIRTAPEVVLQSIYNKSADVFSFGKNRPHFL